ncbi:MAG TPA: hypothetical protein VGC28_03060, partial [Sphingomonas sp.]
LRETGDSADSSQRKGGGHRRAMRNVRHDDISLAWGGRPASLTRPARQRLSIVPDKENRHFSPFPSGWIVS